MRWLTQSIDSTGHCKDPRALKYMFNLYVYFQQSNVSISEDNSSIASLVEIESRAQNMDLIK